MSTTVVLHCASEEERQFDSLFGVGQIEDRPVMVAHHNIDASAGELLEGACMLLVLAHYMVVGACRAVPEAERVRLVEKMRAAIAMTETIALQVYLKLEETRGRTGESDLPPIWEKQP